MLSDKPKLVFTDIAGKPTIEAYLPCQQIKQLLTIKDCDCQFLIAQQLKQAKQYQPTPLESFNYALLQCGEAKL